MRQVFDSNGVPIKGLFRRSDDSLVVINPEEFTKNKISHEAFETLNKEVMDLKFQVQQILEKIHGKSTLPTI